MSQRTSKYPNMTQTTIFGQKNKENSPFSPSRSDIKTVDSSLKSARVLEINETKSKVPQQISPINKSVDHLPVPIENTNLIKQERAGKLFLKKKDRIFEKSSKPKPKKPQNVYYS
jgi:hypothetical protein